MLITLAFHHHLFQFHSFVSKKVERQSISFTPLIREFATSPFQNYLWYINTNTNQVWCYKCVWTNTNTRSRSVVFRFNVSDKSAWVENVGLAAGSFYRLIFLYEIFWIFVNIGGKWTKLSVLCFQIRVIIVHGSF